MHSAERCSVDFPKRKKEKKNAAARERESSRVTRVSACHFLAFYSIQKKLYRLGARSSSHCSWFGTYISAGMRSRPGDSGDPRSFVLRAEKKNKETRQSYSRIISTLPRKKKNNSQIYTSVVRKRNRKEFRGVWCATEFVLVEKKIFPANKIIADTLQKKELF